MPRSESDLLSAVKWLDTVSDDAAKRFTDRLQEEIALLCQHLADEIADSSTHRVMLPPDNDASTYFARPVYRHEFRTGKIRQRRSSAGRWYLFFTVTDDDNDSIPDTLLLYSVRHSARPPLTVEEK